MIDSLVIIAGKGQYPEILARGARRAGVRRIAILRIRGQASRSLTRLADESISIGVGEGRAIRDWIVSTKIPNVVMAGQVSPTALFATRFDSFALSLIKDLKAKNAHSIFGAISDMFQAAGLKVLPASVFMDEAIPQVGVLTSRSPDERETADIAQGRKVATAMGSVDVGQTVVLKGGMTLAVEAFDGTNATLRRGGRLGKRGSVAVKVAREGHDMRFDIPVVGAKTINTMVRHGISCLAVQAGRTIILDRDYVVRKADRHGISIVAFDSGLPAAPTIP